MFVLRNTPEYVWRTEKHRKRVHVDICNPNKTEDTNNDYITTMKPMVITVQTLTRLEGCSKPSPWTAETFQTCFHTTSQAMTSGGQPRE
jgi:hypothetical protein